MLSESGADPAGMVITRAAADRAQSALDDGHAGQDYAALTSYAEDRDSS